MYMYRHRYISTYSELCQKNQWLEFSFIFKKCFMFNKIHHQLIIITFEKETTVLKTVTEL